MRGLKDRAETQARSSDKDSKLGVEDNAGGQEKKNERIKGQN